MNQESTVTRRRVALGLCFALLTQTNVWSQSMWERRAETPPDVVVPLASTSSGATLPSQSYGLDQFRGGTFGNVESRFLMYGKTRAVYTDFRTELPLSSLAIRGSEITQVAISPNDEVLLVGDSDGRLSAFLLDTGYQILEHAGHNAPITALAFAPNGETFATADRDGAFRVWSLRDGPTPTLLGIHGKRASILQFSPSGRLLLIGGPSTPVQVLSTTTGETIQNLGEAASFLITAEFSPDETEVFTAHRRNPTHRVWDLETGELKRELPTFSTTRNAFLFPSLDQSATVETTGNISVYSLSSGQRLNQRGYGFADFASLSASGNYLYRHADLGNGSSNRSTFGEIYSLETNERATIFPNHLGMIRTLDVSPDGSRIVSTSTALLSASRVIDRRSGQVQQTFSPSLLMTRFSEDGSLLYNPHSGVSGADAATGERILFGVDRIGASLQNDRQLFLRAPGEADSTEVYDATHDRTVSFLEDSGGRRNIPYTVSPDQSRIASLAQRVIRIWDTESGDLTREIRTQYASHDLLFLPDSDHLAVFNDEQGIAVWDLDQESEPTLLENQESPISALATSPDGNHFLIGHADGSLRWVEWRSNTQEIVFDGHGAVVTAVAVTPDGQWAVSGDADGLVQLWPIDPTAQGPVQVTRAEGDSLRVAAQNTPFDEPITWYRDDQVISQPGDSADSQLHFASLSVADAGIYHGRTESPDDATETLTLALTVQRPTDVPQSYAEWTEQFPWGTLPTDPGANADGDQHSNFEEYLIGGHPLEPQASGRFMQLDHTESGELRLTLHVAPHANTDDVVLESSNDLGEWTPFDPNFQATPQPDGSEQRHTDLAPDGDQRFFRWSTAP